MYEVIIKERKFIHQLEPQVEVSFQLPFHDWSILEKSGAWCQVERFLEESRRGGELMNSVDKTIEVICEWIQEGLKKTEAIQGNSILPDMTRALAELMVARAALD